MQEGRLLSFESCQLKAKNLLKPIYEKKMLAILRAIKKWHPYRIGRHFKVKTNHDNLKYLLEQQLSLEDQQKWVTIMLGYDFEIIYKKEKQNAVAYALSRKDVDVGGLLCVISLPQLDWVEEARIEWRQDQKACKIIQQLQEDPNALDKCVWKNDLLWYHDLIYLCNSSQLKHKILVELHTSPIGGHSGFLTTYHGIKKYFF